MKKLLCLLSVCAALPLGAHTLPDNLYFKAMKDEMDRSLKQLRLPNNLPPSYIAYWIERIEPQQGVEASFGALMKTSQSSAYLTSRVLVDVGNNKQDSLGIQDGINSWFMPIDNWTDIAQSYLGIRHALWQQTDKAYLQATEMYEKKQAYKRRKQLDDGLPDKTSVAAGSYQENQTPTVQVDVQKLADLAVFLSAKGKDVPYLEDFTVSFQPSKREVYFLNSRGSFAQYSVEGMSGHISAHIRTKRGYKRNVFEWIKWDGSSLGNVPQQSAQAVERVLARAQKMYEAQESSSYVGPVLLMPKAAASLWERRFVSQAMGGKPILWLDGSEDKTAGVFKNKLGMRVSSNVVSLSDRPFLKTYNGFLLSGFMPLDDEGVVPQTLTLVTQGVLRDLPRSSRPLKKGDNTNGHARLSRSYFPREQLTNLVVQPLAPLTHAQLEEKLIEKCRALELEYCYILHDVPERNQVERIYTKDGRKEPVDQLKFETDFTARSLRDIIAAGDMLEVFSYASSNWAAAHSIITPALLIEEMELGPVQTPPDKKPFLPRP